jgi:hypothetical protein
MEGLAYVLSSEPFPYAPDHILTFTHLDGHRQTPYRLRVAVF